MVSAFVVALALPVAAQQIDSPLVAFAKRINRLGKHPVHVITNEEVANSRGRISEIGTIDEDQRTPAAGTAKAAFAGPAAPAAAASRPGTYYVPRAEEREGSSRASYSMPQSTASNASVASTVAPAAVRSTAQNAPAQSTVTPAQVGTTVRSANPPVITPRKVD